MSKAGDLLIHCCNSLHRLPSLLLCFIVILIQDAFINYYLISHLGQEHYAWVAADLIVLILVLICFRLTTPSDIDDDSKTDKSKTYTLTWVTWLSMQAVLAAKILIIFLTFATELEEEASFFGPNTLKMSIALGGCIYVLMLTSQHNAPPSSDRRRYIEELTGTVVTDILDTADILDVLFDPDMRSSLATGLPESILFVAVLNLLLPTVPLITLSITKFGMKKLSKRMVYMHRLLLVLVVNVPNLVLRMALWHGFSVGISPFCLKNIIHICTTAHEFYESEKEKYVKHEEEEREHALQDYGGQNGNSKQPETTQHEGHNGDSKDGDRLTK